MNISWLSFYLQDTDIAVGQQLVVDKIIDKMRKRDGQQVFSISSVFIVPSHLSYR